MEMMTMMMKKRELMIININIHIHHSFNTTPRKAQQLLINHHLISNKSNNTAINFQHVFILFPFMMAVFFFSFFSFFLVSIHRYIVFFPIWKFQEIFRFWLLTFFNSLIVVGCVILLTFFFFNFFFGFWWIVFLAAEVMMLAAKHYYLFGSAQYNLLFSMSHLLLFNVLVEFQIALVT